VASITKIGTTWRAQIYVKGQRDSATFSTKAKAQAWAAQRETELRSQSETGILAGKTLADAFGRYAKEVSPQKKGSRWEGIRLTAIREHEVDGKKLAEYRLTDITPEILAKWRDSRLQAVKGSTFNRDMNLISNVFTVARREWRWIAASPTKDVRRPKNQAARDRRITQEEIDRICLALGFNGEPVKTKMQAVAVAFLFAIETAMRAGEICALRPEWVDGQVVHLPAEIVKNGIKRDVPLSKRATELLSLLPEDRLFDLASASLDALFRTAKERAGVEGLTFHDTRHEAITRLSKKLGVLELARAVGHRDLRMLQVYYNESAADIAQRLG
jgi:integrase